MKFAIRDQLGPPGQIGMVLSVFCLYFYLAILLPAEDRVAQLEALQARRAETAASVDGRLARTPPAADIPSVLKRFNGLAEHSGLSIDRVAYTIKDEARTRRLVVTVPAVGSYPGVRVFVRAALALTPTASLDTFSLQRSQATDPTVSAQLGFSFLFKASP